MTVHTKSPLLLKLNDARRNVLDAVRSGAKGRGNSNESHSVMAIIYGVPKRVMGLEKGQAPQIGETEWFYSLAKQQLPLARAHLRPGAFEDISDALDEVIGMAEWIDPTPAAQKHYRHHPAFALAQQFASMRTDEGRIMAKHYFRVALRGIIAGI